MKASLILKALFMLVLSSTAMQMPVLFGEPSIDECSSVTLREFFPEIYVHATLNKFAVPKEKWAAITEALHAKEKKIIPSIEAKAEKMTPNPLKDRAQQKEAVKLFKETILEEAKGAFNESGIHDEKQIQAMLDDIQSQKTKQFQECIRKHKLPLLQESQDVPLNGAVKK